MQMVDTFSPIVHRLDQVVRWRAVHPNEPVPPPYEILTRFSSPPEELVAQSKRQLRKLIDIAEVKKGKNDGTINMRTDRAKFGAVPPKAQSRKRARNEIKPLSGLDVGALLGNKSKKTRLSSENSIPEFRQALDAAESVEGFALLAKQFAAIIKTRIKNSFGDMNYARAVEEISVMREELIEMEEPGIYNDFIRDLKTQLLAEELGGDRREMWWELKKSRLGLIDKKTSEQSAVEDEEAKAVSLERISIA